MDLNSTIDQFPLWEIITMMHMSSVTGVLEVGVAPNAGYLCCRDGQIYHAICAEQTGMHALRCIAEFQHMPFRFIVGAHSEDVTLRDTTDRLVEYVTLVEQLLQQSRPYVSDITGVPVLCESKHAVQVDMLTWHVLAVIDGERSINTIAALLDADALEVSAIIGSLIERQLAMMLPPLLGQHTTHAAHRDSEPPTKPPLKGLVARIFNENPPISREWTTRIITLVPQT